MLVVSKRQPSQEDIDRWLKESPVPAFIETATETDGEPTVLYDYQIEDMQDESPLQHVTKARQMGISFGDALAELSKIHVYPEEHNSIFVSYNMDDAKEKIRYARMAYETMPMAWRLPLITDSKTEIEFLVRTKTGKTTNSRMISHPQTPVRGKSATVYFDEMAHWREQQLIYTSALPAISRGNLRLKIRSTPFGKVSLFYEIATNKKRFPSFTRKILPWWSCPEFCKNVKVAEVYAERMPTKARVERYGTDRLKNVIFANMDIQDFQQEYECAFIDETTSYYPIDLIDSCCRDEDVLTTYQATDDERPEEAVSQIAKNCHGLMYGGMDVGRKRNTTEFCFLESVANMMLYRAMVTLDNKPFQFQRAFIFNAMNTLVTLKMSMDSTGLGMQLAEEVERKYYSRVEPTVFTNAVKEHLAVTLKRVMESGVLLLPEDMELRRQIHSIKRVVLPGGRFRFDSEKNEKYHADKFWALALAVGRAFGGPSAPAVASSRSQIDQLNRRLPPTETF